MDPLKVFWVLTNSTYLVTKFIRHGITDKQDNPPYFDKVLYEAEVDENEDIQHTILTVNAKSHNESSRIRYEITSGNIDGVFAIQNMTGSIYVAGALDYEIRKRYELRLTATSNQKENYTTVIIYVKDVNDNPPVFERMTYRVQITEEDDRNLPKRILQVTATDLDKDRPQNIYYSLTGQGIDPDNAENSKFDINRITGEIFVLKPLDRDLPNGRPLWRFTVFAQDENGEGLVGYADVQVNLKDINDNAPIFVQGVYYGEVNENGTAAMRVMTIAAVDYDDPSESTNAYLVYSIEKNVIEEETGTPIFEIESDTGVIRTAVCCLDRERTPDYSIQVVAMDGGGLKGTGTASILVKDINDMPPQFTKDEWFAEVDETDGVNISEMPVLTVTVHDDDETNVFQYKVIENSGYGADKFTMIRNKDGTGSLIIVQPLDFEDRLQRNGFRFRIQVNDKGEDNNSDKYHVAYSWVVIKLRDINDNEPQFKRRHIEISVSENTDVGKTLEKFKATDLDQGGKSKVTYAIERSSNRKRQFSVDQEGTVKIQRSLDREDVPIHQVKILAIDDSLPPNTATATLTVIVQDINDNAPWFHEDYRPILTEHVSPRKIVEILATDIDDKSKNNGPPFQFRLDPNAEDIIRASFKVEQDRNGANGDGIAIVSSLRSFDREQEKYYSIPIVIKDNGNPAMTGTSTLTVVIGDINDNKMQQGSKEILVYNYHSQMPDTEIGRVYVYDLDDWDLPDKTFYWDGAQHPQFMVNEDSGMVTILYGTKEGKYNLKFKVYDSKHTQTCLANVAVTVREITHEAVINSGSIRISGITDEDFIRVWNYKTQSLFRSKLDKFKDKITKLLTIELQNLDVFSIQLRKAHPPVTDIRFSIRNSMNYKPVKINGLIMMHQKDIENYVGINITMVGINECLYESETCEGSCTNTLTINASPYTINANKTALVSVQVEVHAECVCGYRDFNKEDSCFTNPCYNGGRCIKYRNTLSCSCPVGYSGANCQQTSRSFHGNGWAWYPPLDICEKSHLSFDFITQKPEGLLLYNGPIVQPDLDEILVSDYIAVELEDGYPRLLIDFGSGTLELRIQTKTSLNDGEWHRLDILWDTETVRMVVDYCKSADITEPDDGNPVTFDNTNCEVQGTIHPFNEYLNVNTPLQIGGMFVKTFEPIQYGWQYKPNGKGFNGCIRNIFYNSKLYDLANPELFQNSDASCSQTEQLCTRSNTTSQCWIHGTCIGSFNEPKCQCRPGWTGAACTSPTIPTHFKPQSYVKYALSFDLDRFSTQLQLRFRTRELSGELFRISDQHSREYAILEIQNSRLHFRYNLDSLRIEEQTISLSEVMVNDGQWHVARASRYGSVAILQLDGGEGRRYNETFNFIGHQWLLVDKQEGVFAGGKAEYTGLRTFEVYADYEKGCLDDIRLNGRNLPLPPAINGTQWGQATMARNLERDCASNKSCANIICPDPFECVDLWNDYDCTCGEGRIVSADATGCTDKNECVDLPCVNGGTCINQEPRLRYRCLCPVGFWGPNCELIQKGQTLKLSIGALAAILCSLLIIFIMVLVFVYNRKREAHTKSPRPDEDVRENIINYADEGGGEDDMTAFDITPLQIPIDGLPPEIAPLKMPIVYEERNILNCIDEYRKRVDNDPNVAPFEDLRNYAYEGGASIAGSLSSLASGTEEDQQEYDYLVAWGPRFNKLADMYGPQPEEENDLEGQLNLQAKLKSTS